MQRIELTPEEAEILGQVVHHALDEVDLEVNRTATYEFKLKLKHRREVLARIREKINVPAVA